jgi:hypothetical protein
LENLQQWNVRFSNPARSQASLDGGVVEEEVSFINNAMRHVILGAELFPRKGFNLRLGYNNGASSWMHSNAIMYPNGKVSQLNIIKGRYTTLI